MSSEEIRMPRKPPSAAPSHRKGVVQSRYDAPASSPRIAAGGPAEALPLPIPSRVAEAPREGSCAPSRPLWKGHCRPQKGALADTACLSSGCWGPRDSPAHHTTPLATCKGGAWGQNPVEWYCYSKPMCGVSWEFSVRLPARPSH